MGRLKTVRGKEFNTLQRAQKMAEAFAKHRTSVFLENFLKGSGLGEAMFATYQDHQGYLKDKIARINQDMDDPRTDDLARQKMREEIEGLEVLVDEPAMASKEYLEKLHDDLDMAFGGVIALSYAMGFGDAMNGATLKTLYVPKEHSDQKDEPDKSQLILPGIE